MRATESVSFTAALPERKVGRAELDVRSGRRAARRCALLLQVDAFRSTPVLLVPTANVTVKPLLTIVAPAPARSGLMKPWPPAVAGAANWASDVAYPPPPQLDENAASPLLIARSDPIADASLPDMRARSRPGIAIAAIMPMIATTISSSMRVKPFALRIFIRNLLRVTSECGKTQQGRYHRPAPPPAL